MFHEELNNLSNNSIKVKYLYTRQNSKNELYNGRIDESKAKELLKLIENDSDRYTKIDNLISKFKSK